jgi:hypothetical protein
MGRSKATGGTAMPEPVEAHGEGRGEGDDEVPF